MKQKIKFLEIYLNKLYINFDRNVEQLTERMLSLFKPSSFNIERVFLSCMLACFPLNLKLCGPHSKIPPLSKK